MQAMSTRETLNIPAGHQLRSQASDVARYLKSSDIDVTCVVAFVSIGLVVTFYLLLFGSFSQEISDALSTLSQGLIEAPRWDDVFLG
jgi:hypothetical protein